MTLIRITAAATKPVDLTAAKAHLRVLHSDHDTEITGFIAAATAHAERLTGLAFLSQTWELVLDCFPDEDIEIDLGPVTSVTSITYLDEDGAEQTMSASDYVVDTASRSGRINAPDGWPTARDTLNAVRVRFVVGTDPDDDVKNAILLLIGHWYKNRAAASVDAVTAVPLAVADLLGLHRRMFV
jgi:uncharacterized phiE125 gp8 family phage protein